MAEHVTFFRMKVQPGKLDEFMALMSGDQDLARAKERGFVGDIVGKSKNDPNEVLGCVTWDTSERYYKNAESPEQNAEYEKMRALLAEDPQWFDCDVVEERFA
jgi:heme-degrading monooxygenase HmoA